MPDTKYVTIGEARDILDVSKRKMRRLIQERGLKVHRNPLDRREKLVSLDDVLNLRNPEPIDFENEDSKKAAA